MQGKKIIIVLIIINILLVGFIYNFIKNDFLNNEKLILKAMTDIEYEDNITSLNQSHTEYANYIEESKKKIASAITDMGIETLETANADTMASNIRSISTSKDAASITYNNTTSGLVSTNVQGAVDELDGKIDGISNSGKFVFGKTTMQITYSGKKPEQFDKIISFGQTFYTAPDYVMAMLLQGRGTFSIISTEAVTTESFSARFYGYCSRNN